MKRTTNTGGRTYLSIALSFFGQFDFLIHFRILYMPYVREELVFPLAFNDLKKTLPSLARRARARFVLHPGFASKRWRTMSSTWSESSSIVLINDMFIIALEEFFKPALDLGDSRGGLVFEFSGEM